MDVCGKLVVFYLTTNHRNGGYWRRFQDLNLEIYWTDEKLFHVGLIIFYVTMQGSEKYN